MASTYIKLPPTSGVTTLSAVGASPNANGASITGSTLTLQPADSTHPGILTSTLYNTFAAKLSSSLTANRIFVGSGANLAVSSGGFTAGSDLDSIIYNGATTKFRVQTLKDGLHAPSYQPISGSRANTIVVRSNDNLGWITVGSGIQGEPSLFPQLYNFASWYDTNDALFIDALNGAIYSPSTGSVAVDVSNYQLNDSGAQISLGFSDRLAYGTSGNVIFDWNDYGDDFGINNRIAYYNSEYTQGNGVPSILGYAEDISVTSSNLTPYTAVVDSLIRVTVTIEVTTGAVGTFDVVVDYVTATNSYTTIVMETVNTTTEGVIMSSASTVPRFKEGATTFTIPLKAGNSITVRTTNHVGLPATFDMKVTAERLN